MKTAVIILAVLATALAAPQGARDDSQTKIVRYINDNNGLDHYHFTYELDDGQIRSEGGVVKEFEDGAKAYVVQGSYSFVGPDGLIYWVNYTADENGYHPVIGTGPEGGIKPGQDVGIDPNALKSLLG